MLASRKL